LNAPKTVRLTRIHANRVCTFREKRWLLLAKAAAGA
jgi:hypothetical protein